jgi:hypothetical protein
VNQLQDHLNILHGQSYPYGQAPSPTLVTPLQQIAQLIKRLSYRDLQGLADAVRDANDLTDITEEALLFAADALESPNV